MVMEVHACMAMGQLLIMIFVVMQSVLCCIQYVVEPLMSYRYFEFNSWDGSL